MSHAQHSSVRCFSRPTGKHNNVLRTMGDAIARTLGNALIAPIVKGLHDDYDISAIIAVHDPNGVRMPERLKAGKFAINGVSLAPIEKTVENGRKIIAFRTEKTVAAIRKAIDATKSSAQ
jgi:hypothetical protein